MAVSPSKAVKSGPGEASAEASWVSIHVMFIDSPSASKAALRRTAPPARARQQNGAGGWIRASPKV
jgi:hypothetical protein